MLYISIIFSLLACVNRDLNEDQLLKFKKEIQQLKTESERDTFLARLFEQDQSIRNNGQWELVIAKYGYDSKEHNDYSKAFYYENLEIFHQLRLYLETHGYTKETTFYSDQAKWTFPYVTGHHPSYEDQLHILKLLVSAFKGELIPINDIVWIMSEMHEVKYKRIFDVGKERYTVEDEFEGLVRKLDLGMLFE